MYREQQQIPQQNGVPFGYGPDANYVGQPQQTQNIPYQNGVPFGHGPDARRIDEQSSDWNQHRRRRVGFGERGDLVSDEQNNNQSFQEKHPTMTQLASLLSGLYIGDGSLFNTLYNPVGTSLSQLFGLLGNNIQKDEQPVEQRYERPRHGGYNHSVEQRYERPRHGGYNHSQQNNSFS